MQEQEINLILIYLVKKAVVIENLKKKTLHFLKFICVKIVWVTNNVPEKIYISNRVCSLTKYFNPQINF